MMHKSGRNDKSTPGASVKSDVTLGDYIARKSDPPKKKLTFEEWWPENNMVFKHISGAETIASSAWKAAQENV